MAIKQQDLMAGYAMLERPKRKRNVEGESKTFEVFDIDNLTKETIHVEGAKPTKKRKRATKQKTIMDIVEGTQDNPEDPPTYNPEHEEGHDVSEYIMEAPLVNRQVVKVYTDITEANIEVMHAHVDENVVCLFMHKDSQTKLKPKKGVTLELEIQGERITVYSPGVYFSAEPFACDIVFLLVQDNIEE